MIAPEDRLLRALGELESQNRAWVTRQTYSVDDRRHQFLGEDMDPLRRGPDYILDLNVRFDGYVNTVEFPTREAQLLRAARAMLPHGKTLTEDELAEQMATWFAARMHRLEVK